MEEKNIEGTTTCPKKNLKWVWQQIWQTIILVGIVVFACISVAAAFNLHYIVCEASPKTTIFVLIMYAIFVYVMVDTIWSAGLKKITNDFWGQQLAYIAFCLLIICGLVSFGVFFYVGYTFWWENILSMRILPLLFGSALFLVFIYKVLFGLGD